MSMPPLSPVAVAEDRDIGDLSELEQLAGEVGLDEPAFRAALESGEFSESHDRSLQKTMTFGVNSVPSVFIDGKLLQGVYDPTTLHSLLVNGIENAVDNP